MIKIPQTERLLNQVVNSPNDENDLLQSSSKSGWKNMIFSTSSVKPSDLIISMRKDLNRPSNELYRWYRNLIIPKIKVTLRSQEPSSSSLKTVFSCFKFHGEKSDRFEQVPMKGQIIQTLAENPKLKERKKQLPQFELYAHSKNLQFSQSHIENRQIFYCLCVTICDIEDGEVLREIAGSVLKPILVENRKQSLQNRTNQFMKFLEFLPVEFTRPLVLPQQESKDDPIFSFCLKLNLKNPLRLAPKTSPYWINDARFSQEKLPIESSEAQLEINNQESQTNSQEIELSNDLGSAFIYLSSKTIRHKIFHPFFLLKRFSQAFELFYLASAFPTNLSIHELLKQIQERFLRKIFEFQENDQAVQEFTSFPLCLIIKSPLEVNQDQDQLIHHKIISQVINFLQCIQINGSLYVGLSNDIPNFEENYLPVNFTEMHYKDVFDDISRIPLRLQEKNIDLLPKPTHSVLRLMKMDQSAVQSGLVELIDHYRTTVELLGPTTILERVKALRPLKQSQVTPSSEHAQSIREKNYQSAHSQTEIFGQENKSKGLSSVSLRECEQLIKTKKDENQKQLTMSSRTEEEEQQIQGEQSVVTRQTVQEKLSQSLNTTEPKKEYRYEEFPQNQAAQPKTNDTAYSIPTLPLSIEQQRQQINIIGQQNQLTNFVHTPNVPNQAAHCSQTAPRDFLPFSALNPPNYPSQFLNPPSNTQIFQQIHMPVHNFPQINNSHPIQSLNFFHQNLTNHQQFQIFPPGFHQNQTLSPYSYLHPPPPVIQSYLNPIQPQNYQSHPVAVQNLTVLQRNQYQL